jgi:hypothetical protein
MGKHGTKDRLRQERDKRVARRLSELTSEGGVRRRAYAGQRRTLARQREFARTMMR